MLARSPRAQRSAPGRRPHRRRPPVRLAARVAGPPRSDRRARRPAGAGHRRRGRDLGGKEGNPRSPINRETYQVTAVRDVGTLEVATTLDGRLQITPNRRPGSPRTRPRPRRVCRRWWSGSSTMPTSCSRVLIGGESVSGARYARPRSLLPAPFGTPWTTDPKGNLPRAVSANVILVHLTDRGRDRTALRHRVTVLAGPLTDRGVPVRIAARL